MANILGVLFPYFVLIYLLDSIRIIRKNHILFFSHLGNRFRVRFSGVRLSDLSPAGQTIYSHCQPFCYTAVGVNMCNDGCNKRSYSHPKRFASTTYENIDSIEVDHATVRINGEPFFRTPSKLSATYVAKMVTQLKRVSPDERRRQIDAYIKTIFNAEKLDALKDKYNRIFGPIKILSSVLFVYIFGLLPLCLFTNVSRFVPLNVLAINIALAYALTVLLAYFSHRKIHGSDGPKSGLFLLVLVLSPLSAIHALRKLSEDLYCSFDYLTLAAVLLKKEQFRMMAEAELRRIHYVFKKSEDEAFHEYWTFREQGIRDLIEGMGISVHHILQKPEKHDESAVSYCPVCLAEHQDGFKECNDCGVELERY